MRLKFILLAIITVFLMRGMALGAISRGFNSLRPLAIWEKADQDTQKWDEARVEGYREGLNDLTHAVNQALGGWPLLTRLIEESDLNGSALAEEIGKCQVEFDRTVNVIQKWYPEESADMAPQEIGTALEQNGEKAVSAIKDLARSIRNVSAQISPDQQTLKAMANLAVNLVNFSERCVVSFVIRGRFDTKGEPQPLDLRPVIEEAITYFQQTSGARHYLVIRTHFADSLPCVLLDKNLAGDVVRNLIRNAAKAAERARQSKVLLNITARLDGNNVVVEFEDNGPGFRDKGGNLLRGADVDKVFEKGVTTESEEGSKHGRGLAIVREIVGNVGGSIEAFQNNPGARVVIHLSAQLNAPTLARPNDSDIRERESSI